MHLINNVYLIPDRLRRNAYLLNQATDIIYRIVLRRIKFVNIKGVSVLKRLAGSTNPASLAVRLQVCTVNGFGKDTGAGSFANSTRAAE